MVLNEQDRSRRCQYIQSIDNFFNGKYWSNRQNIIKFVIYGSELVEIDTLLVQFERHFKKDVFWRPFCLFYENAVSHNFQSYQLILLIFNSKQGTDLNFIVLKFEENRSKFATVRVPQPKAAIMAAMTSSI